MGISLSAIGTRSEPLTTNIERGRLAFFARAIGETNPIYSDIAAAQKAGYPDLPVLPTFYFGLLLETADPFAWLTDLGVDLRDLLHGTQSFLYRGAAHAGDRLTLTTEITDVYEKRGGALEFLVRETQIVRSDADAVATLVETLVVRHSDVRAAA
jgi:hypothetical protein